MAKRIQFRDLPMTPAEVALSDAALELERQRAINNAGRRAKFRAIALELFPDLTAIHGDGGGPLLTIKQIAAEVYRKSFWKFRHILPAPDIPGAGNQPDLWRWSKIRPILIKHFPTVEIPDQPFRPTVQ